MNATHAQRIVLSELYIGPLALDYFDSRDDDIKSAVNECMDAGWIALDQRGRWYATTMGMNLK